MNWDGTSRSIRIIAEYCATQYLVRRIDDASDRLSLGRCLAIIAPNGAVRDELRGMLGWMATLGGVLTQERIIDIDPYAVFANGDPAQLAGASKRRLLTKLKLLAESDSYFRRSDARRRFSVSGFFTDDVVDDVRVQLRTVDHASHLQGLLLELMRGSGVVASLTPELKSLLLAADAPRETRALAHECLIELDGYEHASDFEALVSEGSAASLRIAADMVARKGSDYFGGVQVLGLVRRCADLYPKPGVRERSLESRYFIRELIRFFSPAQVSNYLDQLTSEIKCVCGATKAWRCTCRFSLSKVAGLLLDRFFELTSAPHDPAKIWQWTEPLAFELGRNEKSPSILALSSDNAVRQAIHRLAFANAKTLAEMHEVASHFFAGTGHSGLRMTQEDHVAIIDHAFETDNLLLWRCYYTAHSIYSSQESNPLRAHMRSQARCKEPFLKMWASQERHYRSANRMERRDAPYSRRRHERREAEEKSSRMQGFRSEIALIESGQRWWWLQRFAEHYLHQHDEIDETKGDPAIIERSLRSCLPFLAPHVPSLRDLAQHHGGMIAFVLHAACLAIFRESGTLDGIAIDVLKVVKTDGAGYNGYREGEEQDFEQEIDSRIFTSTQHKIDFAREFVETQLTQAPDAVVQLGLFMRDAIFADIRARMALDWLDRFPAMPVEARRQLFDLYAAEGDRQQLVALIDQRCAAIPALTGNEEDDKLIAQRRLFWLLRHFFFIAQTSDALWHEFSKTDESIFDIEEKAGRFHSGESKGWPRLNAEKVYDVLRRYIPAWPRVFLPSSFGSSDPKGVRAFRFLSEIIWQIGQDEPVSAIPVLDRILSDDIFKGHWVEAKSIRTASLRKRALADFSPPTSAAVNALLDLGALATVEDLRALLVELFAELQVWLKGEATTPLNVFYGAKKRVDENTVRDRVVEMLQFRLSALNLAVNVEQHMANENRCDITTSTVIDGRPVLLAIEAKGQWHKELFSAASAQLANRYSIHPGAAQQGLYLLFWFGADEKIAGVKNDKITSASQLREEIEGRMPDALRALIDAVVLDLSR